MAATWLGGEKQGFSQKAKENASTSIAYLLSAAKLALFPICNARLGNGKNRTIFLFRGCEKISGACLRPTQRRSKALQREGPSSQASHRLSMGPICKAATVKERVPLELTR